MDGLKRKDTTKGPPLRILSLDGGGVRGYSMLIILQELMHRTFVEAEGRAPRRAELPKPCDMFDLIVGTGTGGLIALMIGRLRLDLETCKELYVRLARHVFETDKTLAGIPYRSTLFKATKLESAIKECVREVDDSEGNEWTRSGVASPISAPESRSSMLSTASPRRQPSNASVASFSTRSPTAQMSRPFFGFGGGNSNARLYDERENRTKTAVTAMYKNTSKSGDGALLRSYDSRKEPAPEFDCTIWEAGRATCAIGLAFKPIQIGQTVFHDDGPGNFNPAPVALDEATVNEWPGREVGVMLSVGTGKRPRGSDHNSAQWYDGFLGEFANARQKLIAKIEGSEETHLEMMKSHLAKRGVNVESYYRLNVEVGVGEFAMNEWNSLADISTNTRRYLARNENMMQSLAARLAKIQLAKLRWEHMASSAPGFIEPSLEMSYPLAVELPGDIPLMTSPRESPPARPSYEPGPDKLMPSPGGTTSPRTSHERLQVRPTSVPYQSNVPPAPPRKPVRPFSHPRGDSGPFEGDEDDRLVVMAPTPLQFRKAVASHAPSGQIDETKRFMDRPGHPQQPARIEAPPLPPKTPLPGNTAPPYPMDDGPPPAVNVAMKPDYRGR